MISSILIFVHCYFTKKLSERNKKKVNIKYSKNIFTTSKLQSMDQGEIRALKTMCKSQNI